MGKYLFLRWVEHIAFAALGKGTDSRQAVFKGHDRTADRHEMRALGQFQGDLSPRTADRPCLKERRHRNLLKKSYDLILAYF